MAMEIQHIERWKRSSVLVLCAPDLLLRPSICSSTAVCGCSCFWSIRPATSVIVLQCTEGTLLHHADDRKGENPVCGAIDEQGDANQYLALSML
uniref:Uncharacterized protein n=1 Tax=Triticum urartu TaxID=4572 RepID=A0A8R7QZZ9_TRIUA